MPTINQLIRKGRATTSKKTKAPALRFTYNSLKNRTIRGKGSPQKRPSARSENGNSQNLLRNTPASTQTMYTARSRSSRKKKLSLFDWVT